MEKVLEKPRTFLLCERYMADESTIKLSESEIIKNVYEKDCNASSVPTCDINEYLCSNEPE